MKTYLRVFFIVFAIVLAINVSFHFYEYANWKFSLIIDYLEFCAVTSFLAWSGYYILDKFVFKKYFNFRKKPLIYVISAFLLTCVYSMISMYLYTLMQWAFIPHGKIPFIGYYVHNMVYNVFITILCLLLGFGSKFLFQWKKSLDDNDQIKKEMLISQFELLKTQVNPHFLYNSLNTLTSIIPTDPDKAIDFVQQLSRVFRYSLQYAEHNTVDLCTELKILESYLFLNKQRFGDKLIVEIDVKDSLMNKHLITQVLLMLAENAIKHNEISRHKPLSLKIYNEADAYIVVGNTLQPKMNAENSTHVGLSNIVSRYGLISSEQVFISSSNEKFTVKIPLLEA